MFCNRFTSFAASLLVGVTALGWLSSSANAAAITPFLAQGAGTARTDTFPQTGAGFAANSSGTAQVNALGFWDEGNDGLAVSHDVGLYHYNGSAEVLLAKATIPAGTGAYLENGFRWVNIPTVTLTDTDQSATWYAVMASVGTDTWYEGGVSIANSSFGNFPATIGYYASTPMPSVGGAISFDGFGVNAQYGGGNIGFGTIPNVPEPSSVVLMMLGGVITMWFCKKRSA